MWTEFSGLLILGFVVQIHSHNSLPSIDFQNLDVRIENIRNEANKIGAFEVKNLGQSYYQSMQKFFLNAPSCLQNDQTLPNMVMNDGSVRTTFAKSNSNEYPNCLFDEIEAITKAFDQVDAFVTKIIEDIVEPGTLDYRVSDDSGQIQDLANSPIKEHLHVYTKKDTNESRTFNDKFMVPFHVDNGLYLLITPFPGHGLKIESSDGVVIDTDDIRADSILVLMGRGLTDWLLQGKDESEGFHAAPHAVEALGSMSYSGRSAFARMKVAPLEAVPVNGTIKFKNVFFNEDILKEGHHDMSHDHLTDHYSEATKTTCNEGEAYCWMGCRPIPNCGPNEEMICYSIEHNFFCCDDPNETCTTMDPTCKWECV